MPLVFEWDPRKARANQEVHGIDFEDAATVFGDPLSLTILDSPHSHGEIRFIIVGRSRARRLLVVVHCERDDRIRLISARRATPRERRDYENR